MAKKTLFVFLVFLFTQAACNLPAGPLSAQEEESYIENIFVYPSVAPRDSQPELTVNYFRPAGGPVLMIDCTTAPAVPGAGQITLTGAEQGTSVVTAPLAGFPPGKYTITCTSGNQDSKSNSFEITDAAAPTSEQPAGDFKQHKPGEITSAKLVMLFDQGTTNNTERPVPHQCMPGVVYDYASGTSTLDIAADGTLNGSCNLTAYGNQQLTGTLTGMWDADSGTVTFHLESHWVATYTSNQDTGQSIEDSIYDGTGKVTSEYQATGTATWSTQCTSSNPSLVICSSSQRAGLTANGTVPWQLNFDH